MNYDEIKDIFKDFSEIRLNKNGFTITFLPGTNVLEVYTKLTESIKKMKIENDAKKHDQNEERTE